MEMPERLEFVAETVETPDPLADNYRVYWKMDYQGKEYGGYITSRKLDPDFIKAAIDALEDEAFLCLKLLNEPLIGRDET